MNNENKKYEIFEQIKLKLENQKLHKKQEKLKWEKENQSKTLKKLIEQPKQFLEPKLDKI